MRVTLPHPEVVRDTCALDRLGARRRRARARRAAAAFARVAELAPGVGERALPEQRRGRGPCLCLAGRGPRRAPARRARSARRDRAPPRRCPSPRSGRGRGRRGSRRAGGPCRRRAGRTAAAGRSGGGSPRRSSPPRARTAPRRAARRRERPRAPRRAAASRPRAGSRPPPPPRAFPRGRAQLPKKSPTASIVRVDLLVTVRERDEHALELGRRQVDAALERMPEERRRSAPCRSERRRRSRGPASSWQNSVSIAPTRCTVPNGARPASNRAPRRSSPS